MGVLDATYTYVLLGKEGETDLYPRERDVEVAARLFMTAWVSCLLSVDI